MFFSKNEDLNEEIAILFLLKATENIWEFCYLFWAMLNIAFYLGFIFSIWKNVLFFFR